MELKDVLGYLGIDAEKVKTLDELKPIFEKDFVRASTLTEENELIKPILGKVYGTQENELKKIAKEYEIDFDADDFKEAKRVSEKAKLLTKKIAELKDGKIKEWELKATQGNDEKLTAAEKKAEKALRELQEKNVLLEATVGEYNQFKASKDNELKSFKLDIVKKDAFSKIKFNSTATDLAKKGFLATVHEKYDFDFDTNNEPIIRQKDGQPIKSTKVAGAFMNINEVLEKEAIDAGIYEINPQARQQQSQTIQVQQQQQAPSGRKVAERL